MKAIAIIPARFQSTRFPGKPLVDIGGKSLIQRTWEQAQKCKECSNSIIATDDERIFNHVRSFGADCVMTSVDCPTGTDRLAEVILKRPELLQADVIINVQGDEPCIDPSILSKIAHLLITNKDASIGTAITPIHSEEEFLNPNVVKCVKTPSGKALYFSRSPLPGSKSKNFGQNAYRHLGIYAFRPKFLPIFAELKPTPLQIFEDLEMLKAMENGYEVYVTEVQTQAPDVNAPEDIEKVLKWLKR